jgi:hypothetical protein
MVLVLASVNLGGCPQGIQLTDEVDCDDAYFTLDDVPLPECDAGACADWQTASCEDICMAFDMSQNALTYLPPGVSSDLSSRLERLLPSLARSPTDPACYEISLLLPTRSCGVAPAWSLREPSPLETARHGAR